MNGNTTVIVILVIGIIFIWWLCTSKRGGKYAKEFQEDINEISHDPQKELEYLSTSAANQALLNMKQFNVDPKMEGFQDTQLSYNDSDYTFSPSENDIKFVPSNRIQMSEQSMRHNSGQKERFEHVGMESNNSEIPDGLQGMSQQDIENKMRQMDQQRQMRDPTSCIPQMSMGNMQYDGKDLSQLEIYSAGSSVPTFGLNYRLKGRNFGSSAGELIRGAILPENPYDGLFQSRFMKSQYIHPGVLATDTQHDKVRNFESRRQRHPVINGKDIIVV